MKYPAKHHYKQHYAIACYHDDHLDGVYEMVDLNEAKSIACSEACDESDDSYGYSHVCVVTGDEDYWDLDNPLHTFRRV